MEEGHSSSGLFGVTLDHRTFSLCDHPLPSLTSCKDLGITVSKNLSPRSHSACITAVADQQISLTRHTFLSLVMLTFHLMLSLRAVLIYTEHRKFCVRQRRLKAATNYRTYGSFVPAFSDSLKCHETNKCRIFSQYNV